ncbi:Alpha/Beta hydrolase protein [Aspergillus venezuelensis]
MSSFLQLTPPRDVVYPVETKPSEDAGNNIELEPETMTATNNGDETDEIATTERNHRDRIESFVVEAQDLHMFTVILLHGFGTNGQIFGEEFMRKTQMQKHFPNVKFIFPSAPRRRMSMWKRAWSKGWFDLSSLEAQGFRDAFWPRQTRNNYVDQIILGGVSRGCAASIFNTIGREHQISGFVGLSGLLPFQGEIGGTFDDDVEKAGGDDLFTPVKDENQPSVHAQAVNLIREILDRDPVDILQKPSCKLEEHSYEIGNGPFPRPCVLIEEFSSHENKADYPDFGERLRQITHILNIPVLISHGDQNEVVSIESSRKMNNLIYGWEKLVIPVTYREYEGVDREWDSPWQIKDIISFLSNEIGIPHQSNVEDLNAMEEQWAPNFEDEEFEYDD